MDKNSQPKKSGKTSKTKIDTAIVVAIIGLVGTLLTALLASPVLIAWIQKNNSPISAPPETLTPVLPASATNAVTYTASPLPTLTSTSTTIPIGQDWKSIMSMSLSPLLSSCDPRLLPPTINPSDDISIAAQQFTQDLDNHNDRSWLLAPSPNRKPESGFVNLRISSIVADTGWIKINNKLIINVSTQKDVPEHVNVIDYGLCGGEGQIRRFPSVDFSNNFDTYELKPIYTEADFFTLQPGEFEEFEIPFECKSVGIFYFKVNISYEYSNISNTTDSNKTVGLICPQTFTSWRFDVFGHQFLSSETYQWNGNGYEQKP